MSNNAHSSSDLAQYQSLPLEAKIQMTKQRIKAWYEAWTRFEIYDTATGKTRFSTIDTRDFRAEPEMKATEYIKSAVNGQVYVGFSGGKDSTVLKHIVDSMYDDVPSLFVNSGLEYPEIQKFAISQKNVVTVRPKMRFDEVIKKHGYPVISKSVSQIIKTAKYNKNTYRFQLLEGTAKDKDGNKSLFNVPQWKFLIDAPFDTSSRCCDVMKKSPIHQYEKETGRKALIGTMAQESRNRYISWLKNGCNAFESKKPISQPLSFWTEQDILHYIKKYDVPYCSVYGDIVVDFNDGTPNEQINIIDYLGEYEPEDMLKTTGCNRTGCIFCMFGCHLEKEPNRFQRLKETHPRQYEYCIGGGEMVEGKWQPSKEGLGLGKVLDEIGVKYD
jgi:3'-phosphoadenosine 5'-phosphosulfate sulfotransferase (PAPS reductase)/FAD synthetase